MNEVVRTGLGFAGAFLFSVTAGGVLSLLFLGMVSLVGNVVSGG